MMANTTNAISAKPNKTISIVVMITAVYLPSFVLCTRTTSVITLLWPLFRRGRLGSWSYVHEREGTAGPKSITPTFSRSDP
jgi:hypothetical protein